MSELSSWFQRNLWDSVTHISADKLHLAASELINFLNILSIRNLLFIKVKQKAQNEESIKTKNLLRNVIRVASLCRLETLRNARSLNKISNSWNNRPRFSTTQCRQVRKCKCFYLTEKQRKREIFSCKLECILMLLTEAKSIWIKQPNQLGFLLLANQPAYAIYEFSALKSSWKTKTRNPHRYD